MYKIGKTKVCSKCKKEKPKAAFYTRKSGNYSSWCKVCQRQSSGDRQKKLLTDQSPQNVLKITFYKLIMTSSNAATRQLPWKLTIKDLEEMYRAQGGKCYCSGVMMKLKPPGHVRRDPFLISIDRKDNSVGYTQDNCVLCCWGINLLKGTLSEGELYKFIKDIYDNIIVTNRIQIGISNQLAI